MSTRVGGHDSVASRSSAFGTSVAASDPATSASSATAFNIFWPETLPAWVEQGAPAAFATPRSAGLRIAEPCRRVLPVRRVALAVRRSTAAWTPAPRCTSTRRSVIAHNHSFLSARRSSPSVSRRTKTASSSATAPASRERLLKGKAFNMPMWLDHPVKDRRSWEPFKKRLDPAHPERYPSDWDAYAAEINALDCPVSMEVGGFFGYLNMWVGTEALMYLFYDDPALVEDMMDTVLAPRDRRWSGGSRRISASTGLVLGGHGLQERPDDQPGDGAHVHAASLPEAQRGHPRAQGARSSTWTATATSTSSSHSGLRRASTSSGLSSALPAWTRWRCVSSTARTSSLAAGSTSGSSCATRAPLQREVMTQGADLVESGPYFPSPRPPGAHRRAVRELLLFIHLLREIRGDEPLDF